MHFRTWVLVPLQGRCRVRLGVWALVPLQGAAAGFPELCALGSVGAGAAAGPLPCALGSVGAGAAAGCRCRVSRCCARLGAWALVPLQGRCRVRLGAWVLVSLQGRCRVRLGAWVLVLLQGAAAGFPDVVCAWERGCWCRCRAAAVCASERGCWCRCRVPLQGFPMLCALGSLIAKQLGFFVVPAHVGPNIDRVASVVV